jgi:hypothetical protein
LHFFFFSKQTVKFIFGGRTTAVLAFDLTYHMVDEDEEEVDNDADENIDHHTSHNSDGNTMDACWSRIKKSCQSRRPISQKSMDFVIASTGTPIIQETNFATELEMAALQPLAVSPQADVAVPDVQLNSADATLATDATIVIASPISSAVRERRRSSLKFQVPRAARRSITRDTGYVPIVSAHLHYTPICSCHSTALAAIADSWIYTFVMIVCAISFILATAFESNTMSVGKIPFFVPVMAVTTFYAFCEFARLDRTLLKYLIRKFDFWFMLLSLIGYCALSLYQNKTVNSTICHPKLSDFNEAWLSSVCANYMFFVANIFTFVWDAAPFVGRPTKLAFVFLVCVNSAFQIYNNRLASLYVFSYSFTYVVLKLFQFCLTFFCFVFELSFSVAPFPINRRVLLTSG